MAYNEWTCTIYSRKMLQSQQQDHLAGKAHSNRLKQISSARAPSNPSLQLATAEDSPAVVSTSTARTQKAKPKPAKTTHRSRTAKAKNRNAGDKAVGISSPQPPETDAHPNWGYIGFQQSTRTFAASYDVTGYGYDDYYSGKGDNFGLCDKDCGWCGHCMDNFDI